MRNMLCVVIGVLWMCMGARATIVVDFTIEPGGLYNPLVNPAQVPTSGGRREIAVFLRNTDAGNDGLGAFQLDLQALQSGASGVGSVSGTSSTGRGSRYHTPDWSEDDNSLGPILPTGPIPVSPATIGLYGTVIGNGDPNAPSHLVGWIVVDLAARPVGSTITIRPANFQAFGLLGDNLSDAIGQAATFVYVPEPGALLLVGITGVVFVARRRAGGLR